MKKNAYMAPEMEVVKLKINQALLTESDPTPGKDPDPYTGDE